MGETRHCDLKLFGVTLEERIVGCDEGRSLEIDICDWEKPPIIKSQGALC